MDPKISRKSFPIPTQAFISLMVPLDIPEVTGKGQSARSNTEKSHSQEEVPIGMVEPMEEEK